MDLVKKIILFYYEGFRSMTIGRTLWLIIFIKLFIFFFIFRLLLFPDFLDKKFRTTDDKSNYVIEELTKNVN